MFDTEALLNSGGLLILLFVVYGQIGLFFCFFLPGGGFMFAAGLLIATGGFDYTVSTVCILLVIAAMAGNVTGYWFGWKTRHWIYEREDSRFLKRRYLASGENFYKKHGPIALTIGLFFPIIRTFAPIVSGIIRLNFSRFLLFTGFGSVAYVLCFVLAGYLMGTSPFLKPYLPYIIILTILVITLPVVIRINREMKKERPG